ncbi:type II toxin-antitoxin system VapC family toxin [Blastomonas sp. AAP53]|uniref:type II toxin-antitoxin system VapC family toxin n=1 Tax=Blastomonas sp. AAP53 TaxID=1248760 RepID=UPI00030C3AA0|nr:type II toxin-antitoxin system VapC family toxin [Blastomonas sp. AAP53]
MKLLLDTHILLWWLDDDPRLTRKTRALISEPSNGVLVSQVSLWETAIKQRIGKLHVGPGEILPRLPEFGFDLLGLSNVHLLALTHLPHHHGDPFDHLLLAQAQVEQACLVSADMVLHQYGVPCIPA